MSQIKSQSTAHLVGEIAYELKRTPAGFLPLTVVVFHPGKDGQKVQSRIQTVWFNPMSEGVAEKYQQGDFVDIQATIKSRKAQGEQARWELQLVGDSIKYAEGGAASVDDIKREFDAKDMGPDDDGIPF